MSVSLPPNSNTFLVPTGVRLSTIFAVIAEGPQETIYGIKPRMRIGFEVHDYRFQWEKDGVENNVPATIWRGYNVSMHSNATLRIDIEGVLGRTLTKAEARDYDFFDLVGRSCQLTIEHNDAGERTYNNIKSVTQLMHGIEVPPLEMDEVRYLKPSHIADWDLVPEFIQKRISNPAKGDTATHPPPSDFEDDDIDTAFKDDLPDEIPFD